LTNEIASSANIEVHARIIKENFIKRQLITKSSNIIQTSYGSADMGECLDVAEEMIDSVTNVITSNKEVKHISKNSDDVIGDIEKRKYNFEHDIITAIPTGLRTLDYELYGGWQKSDMIIIGGRPGMGKTAMIIKFALAAAESGLKVVLFELEMSKKKIYERMLAAVTLVEPRKIKSGDLTEQEVEELIKGREYLDNLPIYIDESTNLTVLMLKAKIRRLKAKGLCDIVFFPVFRHVYSDYVLLAIKQEISY
jgi:replicative DNA helicase